MLLKRIKDLREDNDFMQKQVADNLSIPERTYGNYEMGIRQIPLTVLKDLARFYNTSVDYILEMTDEYTAYPQSKK